MRRGFLAERDDFGQRRAVFALERMDEVQPLLELLQPRRVNVHFVGVARKLRLQFAQGGHGLRVQLSERRRAGIHALQFLQRAANDAGLREQRGFVLAQQSSAAWLNCSSFAALLARL